MVSLKSNRRQRRCPSLLGIRFIYVTLVLFVATSCIPLLAWGQVPVAPQAPVPGPDSRQQQRPPGQQKPPPGKEYVFRPELTNPEFGECLQLEKNWKTLWGNYTQIYEQTRWMHPSSPQYAQTTYYLQQLKMQLDAVWNTFSTKCIHFPRR
jgi:hypothetical protein